MKICHIIGDSAFGGGSKVISALAGRSAASGHDVSVLTSCFEFQRALTSRGVRHIGLECIWRDIRPGRDLIGLKQLVRHLRAAQYDLVHTHTSKAGFVGRLAARLASVPHVVHTVHGFAFHEGSERRHILLYGSLERLAARWCDRVVTVSEHHRKWALELGIGDAQKVLAIPNGVPPPPPTARVTIPSLRAELNLNPGQPVILASGRLAPEKGLESLLDACAELKCTVAGGGAPLLILAGEGPLAARLRARAAALGIAQRVLFLGFRSDIWALLAIADVVALPSLREGLSIALLEAMAAGRAVVASDIASNLEATDMGATALIVPRGDTESLAVALAELLADADRRARLGAAAQERWSQFYREERMLAGYLDLYKELAGRD